jgi:DNA-binding MarR family transcriptional regulator
VTRGETQGIVERRAGHGDRGQVDVHLCAAGKAAVEALTRLHLPEVRALQAELLPADRRAPVG